jgi:hypothetical protein
MLIAMIKSLADNQLNPESWAFSSKTWGKSQKNGDQLGLESDSYPSSAVTLKGLKPSAIDHTLLTA